MLTTTVNFTPRRAPSPEIRARDTLNDGAANGSAGVNSAPNVDAGVNSAADLGGQRCGNHEDRGDSTNYRKNAEHNLSLPLGLVRVSELSSLSLCQDNCPPWQGRTNVWRRITSPTGRLKRRRSMRLAGSATYGWMSMSDDADY